MKSLILLTMAFGAPRAATAAIDKTSELLALHGSIRANPAGPMPLAAANYRFLLVPGYAWQRMPDYHGPNLRRLREKGLDAHFVETAPFGEIKSNAASLARIIAASDKPVFIIAHSRGGLEALSALGQVFDQRKVRAIATLQTPWGGTPLADLALRARRPSARWGRADPFRWGEGTLWPGIPQIAELSRARRSMTPPPPKGPKIFSVATRIDPARPAPLGARLAHRLLRVAGAADNDGIVATGWSLVPGADFAVLDHVSHWDVIADRASWPLRIFGLRAHEPNFAADLTEAIVRLIL